MKKAVLVLGLIITSTLISCSDSCEQKSTEKFWEEQAKIDDLKSGVELIKTSYDLKLYGSVKTLAMNYFEDYSTEYRLVSRMTNKHIEMSENNIIRLGEILIKEAEFELEEKKMSFIKICKQ